jgi:hypothetical protein
MATNNATDTSNPVSIAQGGTGASSMATTNGVAYYNGTDLVVTSAGTAGQVLTSNGVGSAPTYQAGSSTGQSMVFLASQTVTTNTANVQFILSNYATYNQYFFLYSNVVPQTSAAVLYLNFTTTGSFPGVTSNFSSGFWSVPSLSSTVTNANSTSTMIISGPLATTAGVGVCGFIDCFTKSTDLIWASGNCAFTGSTSGSNTYGWFSTYNPSSAPNGFEFIMSSGDISTGTFSLYGLAE